MGLDAVSLLLYGALRSPRVLAAGWGFSCAMFYMAFFSSVDAGRGGGVMWGMSALFALTVLGLVLSVVAGARRVA